MNITYRQNGDYLIPNIIIRKTKPIGHYGRLPQGRIWKCTVRYCSMNWYYPTSSFEHCAEIDEAARNRIELIVRSLVEQNGVTEQNKNQKPKGGGAEEERGKGKGEEGKRGKGMEIKRERADRNRVGSFFVYSARGAPKGGNPQNTQKEGEVYSRTARVSIARWNLKEAVSKSLVRRTEIT